MGGWNIQMDATKCPAFMRGWCIIILYGVVYVCLVHKALICFVLSKQHHQTSKRVRHAHFPFIMRAMQWWRDEWTKFTRTLFINFHVACCVFKCSRRRQHRSVWIWVESVQKLSKMYNEVSCVSYTPFRANRRWGGDTIYDCSQIAVPRINVEFCYTSSQFVWTEDLLHQTMRENCIFAIQCFQFTVAHLPYGTRTRLTSLLSLICWRYTSLVNACKHV